MPDAQRSGEQQSAPAARSSAARQALRLGALLASFLVGFAASFLTFFVEPVATPARDWVYEWFGLGDPPLPDDAVGVRITDVVPLDGGEGLGRTVRVEGTAQGVPDEWLLWLVVNPADGRYYPRATPVGRRADGTWTQRAVLGVVTTPLPPGQEFALQVYAGPDEVFTPIRAYLDSTDGARRTGLDDLGGDLALLAEAVVTRTR